VYLGWVGVVPRAAMAQAGEHDESLVLGAQVHAVASVAVEMSPQGGRQTQAVMQNVFELIPNIPLYPPGPLISPLARNVHHVS